MRRLAAARQLDQSGAVAAAKTTSAAVELSQNEAKAQMQQPQTCRLHLAATNVPNKNKKIGPGIEEWNG